MKRIIATAAKRLLGGLGYQVIRKNLDEIAPWEDMQRFIARDSPVTIFDVGANIGQTITKAMDCYPRSCIHAFEPSPTTFALLQGRCGSMQNVTMWNLGVGSSDSVMTLNENDYSFMSSFLKPVETCRGKTRAATDVEVVSVDSFCRSHDIRELDILKIDTQGFEYEVLKGARRMMNENRIKIIYFELTIRGLYHDLPPYYKLLEYLEGHGFCLASFYAPHIKDRLVSWTNMLYVNKTCFFD